MVVRAVAVAGAALEARNNAGMTPLLFAVERANRRKPGFFSAAAVTALLRAGANPRVVNEHGHSLLHIAARGGHAHIAAVLAGEGGPMDARTKSPSLLLSIVFFLSLPPSLSLYRILSPALSLSLPLSLSLALSLSRSLPPCLSLARANTLSLPSRSLAPTRFPSVSAQPTLAATLHLAHESIAATTFCKYPVRRENLD